jgi:ribosomal protein L18
MKNIKTFRRNRIKQRIKKVISGTPEYPRLSIFRSNKEIYCQVIDDINGKTLVQTSSRDKAISDLKFTWKSGSERVIIPSILLTDLYDGVYLSQLITPSYLIPHQL